MLFTCVGSGAPHKSLILKGLVRRRCSVRWSHIINLRSLFLPAFFFLSCRPRPFLAQSRYWHLKDSQAKLIDLADAHDLLPVDFKYSISPQLDVLFEPSLMLTVRTISLTCLATLNVSFCTKKIQWDQHGWSLVLWHRIKILVSRIKWFEGPCLFPLMFLLLARWMLKCFTLNWNERFSYWWGFFCLFFPAFRLAQMERSNGSLPTDSSSATGSM